MKRFVAAAAGVLLLFPATANAAVQISEVAWMGTATSHTDEWIELNNTGSSSVTITGWALLASDGSPEIPLSGTIPAGGFFLLERSGDGTIPDVPADQVYTGALSNGGEKLVLIDASGEEIDVVDGRDGWSLGGDNSTKETLQRVSSEEWATAQATPKTPYSSDTAQAETEETTGNTQETSSQNSTPVFQPEKSISVRFTDLPDTTVAGAGMRFAAQAYGFEGGALGARGTRYIWSFGDGSKTEAQNPVHAYSYPGEYIVFVTAASGKYAAHDRATVTVIPADIAISDIGGAHDFYIEVSNNTGYELDLSRWLLSSAGKQFYIPEDTYILAGSSVRFAPEITALSRPRNVCNSSIALLYPNGEKAAEYKCKPTYAPAAEASAAAGAPAEAKPKSPQEGIESTAAVSLSADKPRTDSAAQTHGASLPQEGKEDEQKSDNPWWQWLLAAGALSAAGIAGVVLSSSKKRNPADEFEVIEKTDSDA